MTPAGRRPPHVAVCAPGEPSPAELDAAERVGRALAARGCVLVCGGLGGAMAAACRGAKAAGGTTIGILPGTDPAAANPWVDHAVCTGLGQARNAVLAATGQALIAVGGGVGTLSEIALGLRLGRPVVLLGGWAPVLATPAATDLIRSSPGRLAIASTPDEAVELALAAVAAS
jgi:uncharacterized protein (TIGR00725 family)